MTLLVTILSDYHFFPFLRFIILILDEKPNLEQGEENRKKSLDRGHILFHLTVWIFHDFSITQIFREINFGDFTSEESAIFAILEALNFVLW